MLKKCPERYQDPKINPIECNILSIETQHNLI